MRTLYLRCDMGAAGDMLMAALLELTDRQAFLSKINSLGLSDTEVAARTAIQQNIIGTQMSVKINSVEEESLDVKSGVTIAVTQHIDETMRSVKEIESIITALAVSERVRNDTLSVYRMLAEAEGYVHGKSVSEVHFCRLGTMDAIEDILGVALLIEMIAPEKIIASPVRTGFGSIHCRRGILPVPAPAAAYLLRNIPTYSGDIEGELCTPTGAALLRYYASEFGQQPAMQNLQIGHGFGKKVFAKPSYVTACLGEY